MQKLRRLSLSGYSLVLGAGIAILTYLLRTYVFKSSLGIVWICLAGGVLAWAGVVGLRKTVRRLQRAMGEVAHGDLTVRASMKSAIRDMDTLIYNFDHQLVGNLQVILSR